MSPTRDRAESRRWSPFSVAGALLAAALLVGLVAVIGLFVALGAQASAGDGESAVATREMTIESVPEEEIVAQPIIDRLDPETVLTLRAVGFEPDTTGVIRQCVDEGGGRSCRNSLEVRFDDSGSAVFQYLVTDAIGAAGDSGPCRLTSRARCTIELGTRESRTVIDTVFVDEAPSPGVLEVAPRRDLAVGQDVTITASGFPPEADLAVTVCAIPATRGDRCGAPAPEATLRTDDAGNGAVALALDVADVGADGVACGRRTRCHMVVASDQLGVRARPVALVFRETAGADYDPGRLALGLVAGAVLAAAAVWIVRSTDWAPPPEGDGAVIDATPFADLDKEAADPPG